MADSNSGDSATQRREKLKALRERRGTGRRGPAGGAEESGEAESGSGDRRARLRQIMQQRAGRGETPAAGGGGAGGGPGGRRARIRQAMQNPEQREKLLERFPQLRERMSSGGGGGPARRGAAAGGRGAPGGARRPGGLESPALGRQVKALESRLEALEEELRKVRGEEAATDATAETGGREGGGDSKKKDITDSR